MISPEEFALLNQNAHQFYNSQAKTKPMTKNKGGLRGSSPTAFLSELGGTGGAIGGAAIGSALLPGVGTLIGGALGGFIGGTGGKLAENQIRDGEFRPGQALKEGAISGVMGAGPIRAAKAIGQGSAALVKGGAATGLEDALVAAGKGATGPGLTSAAAGQMGKSADALTVKSFRFSPKQITDYKDTHKEDVLDTIKKWGIKTPEDIQPKAIDPLMQNFDEAVGAIGDVSKKDLMAKFKEAYQPLLSGGVNTNKIIGKKLQAQAATINKKYGSTIPATEVNDLRKQFDNVVLYTQRAMNPNRYDVNKRAADAVRGTLHDAADKAGIKNSAGLSLRDIGQEVSKVIDLSNIANKQTGLGRGAQTLRLTDMLGAGAGGAAGGGPIGAMAGAGVAHAINSPSGTRALSSTIGGLGRATGKVGGMLDSVGASPAGAGLRVAGTGAAMGALNGMTQQPSSLEDAMMNGQSSFQNTSVQSPTTMPANNPMNMNTGYQNSADSSSTSDEYTSPYSKQNLIADIQRDPKHAKEYISYYKELADIYAPPETKGKNSTASGVIADTKTGLNALQELDSNIGTSNANNPLLGFLRGKNPLDTNAQNLQAQIAATKQIVGKALEGGVLRKEDEAKYAKILPTMNDTDATAHAKIQYLHYLIAQRLDEYQSQLGGGGGGTLEDALMASQQSGSYQ